MGKILGQGGENVKRLQEMTGCRIAVLGRGSMKDKTKVSITQSLQSLRSGPYGHPKTRDPRLFLLCWHRRDDRDVDPSNAEDDMKPPWSSPAFISRSN